MRYHNPHNNADQKVHATKADEALPDGRLACPPPQGSNFLDTPSVEGPSAVEHDRCRHDEECPFSSWHASGPHRRHQVHSCRILARDQCHVDDADDKSWDRDNDRKREPVEEVPSFAELHAASTFLQRRRMIDGHIERR